MPVAEPSVVLRPPLKWAGGKRWQVPYLRPLWTRHAKRRLVEPFCGGLGVAFGLRPGRALLNDSNPHLINFYRWIQKGLRTDLRMDNDKELFYQHRDRFNALQTSGQAGSAESAALFYYLNRTGYNGLCRFNSQGGFNVPFGRYSQITYTRDFSAYREAVESWQFTAGDVEGLAISRGDFIYADPPYDVEFTSYSSGGFSWDDQERSALWLAKHRGPVVIVNQATPRVEALYRKLGFTISFLDAPRRISCSGDRSPAREIVGTRHM